MYSTIAAAVKKAKKIKNNTFPIEDRRTLYIIYIPEDQAYDIATDNDLDTFYLGLQPIATV